MIELTALACLSEFLLFKTERYENSPFLAILKPGIL